MKRWFLAVKAIDGNEVFEFSNPESRKRAIATLLERDPALDYATSEGEVEA